MQKEARIPLESLVAQPYQGLIAVDRQLKAGRLDQGLADLIRLRVSQINGCTFCVDMHGRHLRERGESFERLNLLATWREAPVFDAREKAALHWAECMTGIDRPERLEPAYEELARHYSAQEIAELVMVIGVINAWNRIAVSTRKPLPA